MNSGPDMNDKESMDRLIDENDFLRSALEQTEQGKELIQQREEFSLLLSVSKLIVSELSLDNVFQLVASKARDLVQADMLLVPMLNAQRDRYTYRAAAGPDAETVFGAEFSVTVGMCGWVLENERSLLFGEASEFWLDSATVWEKGQQSAVLVPLFGRRQIIGGLSALGKKGGGSFTPHDLDLLTMFANQVSTAIENATLFQNIQSEMEERRLAEEALRESEARYRRITEGLTDYQYTVRVENGRAVETSQSPACEAVTGYAAEEFAADPYLWITMVAPEDRELVRESVEQVLSGKDVPSIEHRIIRKDGETIWVNDTTILFRDASGNLLSYDGVIKDITVRKLTEENVLRSLKEKEVMLKEIHHRVKNNMQVINSLLSLQSKIVADPTIRTMFVESQNRIQSMALIHEKLYQSRDMAHIDFREYLKSLVQNIASTFKRQDVQISVEMEPIALDVNIGIPCGLIVNELVSNCLKHAFPQSRSGTITLGIRRDGDGNNILSVADDGIGFSETVDFRNTASLGLQLVNVLTAQIHGTIEMVVDRGTKFIITFPGGGGKRK